MDHLASESAALVLLDGSEFEKSEHGVQAIDVQAGGMIEDTREALSPSLVHVTNTSSGQKFFYAQVQCTLNITSGGVPVRTYILSPSLIAFSIRENMQASLYWK